ALRRDQVILKPRDEVGFRPRARDALEKRERAVELGPRSVTHDGRENGHRERHRAARVITIGSHLSVLHRLPHRVSMYHWSSGLGYWGLPIGRLHIPSVHSRRG